MLKSSQPRCEPWATPEWTVASVKLYHLFSHFVFCSLGQNESMKAKFHQYPKILGGELRKCLKKYTLVIIFGLNLCCMDISWVDQKLLWMQLILILKTATNV